MVDVNTNHKTAQTEVFPEVATIDTPPVGHVAVANKAGVMTAKTHDGIETELGGTSLLHNWTATSDPTADDDSGDGYSAGSLWLNTVSGEIAYCADATLTAAVWHQVVTISTTQILFNKTIWDAAIPSFINAQHGHTSAATGGLLSAGAIGSGTLVHERGGLEADVSGANGLIKISGGLTSAVTAPTGTVVGHTDSQTLTNKTMDADSNTVSNIGAAEVKADLISGATEITSVDGANDFLHIWDATDSALKKVNPDNLASLQYHQQGFILRWLANDKIIVTGGSVVHGSTVLNKTVGTVLTMGTAGDWIDGASGEAASAFASVYINSSGTLKLHDTLPNNSSSVAATFVANMRVNQAGWNGTAGNGLDATSVVYDTDTGEGSIAAGMLLGIYSDSIFTTGRGKGSAAAASLDDMSFALITAVNTGTNTLTLEAGHQIAINDNDYLIVIENAPVIYRDESGTVWRWLGAMYNNGSSNLDSNRIHSRAFYQANEGADYTTTSSSFGSINSTSFNHDLILTEVADVICSLAGSAEHSSASARTYFGLLADGSQLVADDGLTFFINPDAAGASREVIVNFSKPVTALLPGTHNFRPQWKTSAATATMHAGAGTASNDSHAEFTAYILR